MDQLQQTNIGLFKRRAPGAIESVFAFDDAISYLNFELRNLRKRDPKFSLRSWAERLGYENPSFLSQVLRRDRNLKPNLAARISESLNHTANEKKYFELLVLGASSPEGNQRAFQRVLKANRPKQSVRQNPISLELFTAISDWCHYAITEMPQLKGFESSEKYIRSRLGFGVSLRTVRDVVDRLVRLGFLAKNEAGALTRGNVGNYTFDPETANKGLRALHRQWLDRAKIAIEEQSRDERDFYFTSLSFCRENMPAVREILREAHLKVQALEAKRDGEEIYVFSSQFFRITKPSVRKKK